MHYQLQVIVDTGNSLHCTLYIFVYHITKLLN